MTLESNRNYRCVAFDAVGTLIHADPPVAAVYHEVGLKYGKVDSPEAIKSSFQKVLAGRSENSKTSEETERAFWRKSIRAVLGIVPDEEARFRELHEHFARPTSWAVDKEAGPTLAALKRGGFLIAVASNFDGRLNRILDECPDFSSVDVRIISSELGWQKPDRRFFEAVSERTGCLPEEILMIGDTLETDILPAEEFGMGALWLVTRPDEAREPRGKIRSLKQILEHCGVQAFDETASVIKA